VPDDVTDPPGQQQQPPNAIRYALTTQARPDPEKPRSLWIDGSATLTTVTSSTIISTPVHSTYSASQRFRSAVLVISTSSSRRRLRRSLVFFDDLRRPPTRQPVQLSGAIASL
jgi:hypothetical protein